MQSAGATAIAQTGAAGGGFRLSWRPSGRSVAKARKYAGVVVRAGLRRTEFWRIDARLRRNALAHLPVIIGSRWRALLEQPLCGLILIGSRREANADERAKLKSVVDDALERAIPVIALSDSAPLALKSAGREASFEASVSKVAAGVLIDDGVEILPTRGDVDRAIDAMAAA